MINEIKRRIRKLEKMKRDKMVYFIARREGKKVKVGFKIKERTPYFDGQLQAYKDLLDLTKEKEG